MKWVLNLAERTTPDQLKTKLTALRDGWVQTTPQESHDYADLDQLIHEKFGGDRAPLVQRKADQVKAKSVTLDAAHTACVADMNSAIDAAAAVAKAMGNAEVRVSISGHYEPDHALGIDKRVTIAIDQAL